MLTVTKRRPRCGFCGRAFTPTRRGRPQLYCSASHRQRGYEVRRARAQVEAEKPSLLLGRDIHAMQTKAGIERAVVDVLRAKHRLHAALSVFLLIVFFVVIELDLLRSYNFFTSPTALTSAFVMIWFLPLFLLSAAPAKAISRRLIFLAIGLILLIALNELSKLGLDVTAPKLQG